MLYLNVNQNSNTMAHSKLDLFLKRNQKRNAHFYMPAAVAGVKNAWHIDHIYSIMHGYKNKVSPLVIGHIKNLRMSPWEENLSKHGSSDISITELLMNTNYTEERSLAEYEIVMNLIRDDMNKSSLLSVGLLLE